MERTIRVTGKGKLAVHPDMTRLEITLEGIHPEYEAALAFSNAKTEVIRQLVERHGFDRHDLKTLRFDVEASYKYSNDSYRTKIFEGYKFEHRMKLEFMSDTKLLGRLLYELAHSDTDPELSLSYTVADP